MNIIDSRSFHAFKIEGANLLFDRSSGSLLEIDEATFEYFYSIEHGLESQLSLDHVQVISETIGALQLKGMFQYHPVNHDEQNKLIERLWRHHPRRVQLLMAQGCNLGCRYCYAWRNGSNQKKTLMSYDMGRSAIDHLIKNSGSRTDLQVTFFGGEPLLNIEVMRQLVTYCRQLEKTSDKTFLFELITNGTLLDKSIVDWLVSENFLLFISIDGWKEMHNFNRPSMDGTDQYEVILANALYANQQYIKHNLTPIKVRANLTNKFCDTKKVTDYLYSLGFKVVGVGAISPLPHGDTSPSSMTEDQMDELSENSRRYAMESLQKLEFGDRLSPFETKVLKDYSSIPQPISVKGITCGVARNTQVVDNRGNIYPCHRYEGMENYIIGNVTQGLDKEKTLNYYHKLNKNATNRCHSCWIRDYCAGGCAWLLSKKDGHLADPTERECDRRRKATETALWVRMKLRHKLGDQERPLKSWDWGAAEEFNEYTDEDSMELAQKEPCGTKSCEDCGSNGCGN